MVVLHHLHILTVPDDEVVQVLHRALVDPPDVFVGQALHNEVYLVLVFQPVLKDVKLQRAHHAHNDLLHAGVGDLEDLNGALLSDLLGPLDELLALQRVLGAHPAEMLRGEGGDGVKFALGVWGADGVPDGEDAGVKDADDVPGVGLFNDLPLGCHQLLRPGEPQLPLPLHMVDLLVSVKPAGADPDEGDSVPVGLVHIGLNLKDKAGEIVREGVHHLISRLSGERCGGHAQKLLQKRLNAEAGQRRAEEHRGELSVADSL